MAEKYIMQNMINGVCQYPDLWPNTETDLGSFILNLPSINGDVFKVGVKKELDYIESAEQEYIGNGIHTFTVPAGITKMNYGITAKNGISILDNTFKIGSTSVQMPLNLYATMNHTNQYINNRLTVKDNIIAIYARNTSSPSNIRVSFDRGSTWEDRHCSYAPAGKIIVGGDNDDIWVIASINTNAVVTYSLDSGTTWHQVTMPINSTPSEWIHINPFYYNGTWYFSNYYCNSFSKTTNFIDWVIWGPDLTQNLGIDDITFSGNTFRQMFSVGNRIYILAETIIEINYEDVSVIPVIYYTDNEFQSISIYKSPFYEIEPFTEYRYAWADNSSNTIYFIDQTFKKIYKTTNGFINHTMVYDGSSTLTNLNVVNSGLSKDYLYIFNTSSFGNSKVYQLKRSNDSSTFTQMTGLGEPTQNTIIDSSAKYNSNEICLLAYSSSPDSISIRKTKENSTDYTGTYINDNNSSSTDSWVSNVPIGFPMMWKNNITVTPGQTFNVFLTGGDGHAIFRWGTGNAIRV